MKKIDFQKILEKLKISDKKIFYSDLLKMLSIILLLFILINTLLYLYMNFKIKNSFEDSTISKSDLNNKVVFNIEKILLFSSAYATSKDTNLDIWNLDLSQYTDIAIYINNNIENGLSDENIIKSLSINNITFNPIPTLGTPNLNYKNIQNFGKYVDIENVSNLNFNIIDYNSEINFENPEIYNSLQTPITLGFVNKNIKTDYSLINNNEILNFDGSLLKKCKILLGDISSNISFEIKIINNLNQEFICNISIPILLEDKNNNLNIYDGNIYKTLNFSNEYSFYRIQ